jgi:hypothetical protein
VPAPARERAVAVPGVVPLGVLVPPFLPDQRIPRVRAGVLAAARSGAGGGEQQHEDDEQGREGGGHAAAQVA